MEVKSKQQWSDEEAQCFLALWSSSEVQNKFEGASRTKPIFETIQKEMAAAGYDRSIDQLVNKLKKLKKEYRDQRKELGRNVSGGGRQRRNIHFDLLHSVMGNRSANQPGLNSTTASASSMLESRVDDPGADTELSTLDIEADPPRPPVCSSPAPSCSSSSTSSSHTRSGKRKSNLSADLLEYLEQLEKLGVQRTSSQVRAKLKKMRHLYKTVKNDGQKNFTFFDIKDNVLGQRGGSAGQLRNSDTPKYTKSPLAQPADKSQPTESSGTSAIRRGNHKVRSETRKPRADGDNAKDFFSAMTECHRQWLEKEQEQRREEWEREAQLRREEMQQELSLRREEAEREERLRREEMEARSRDSELLTSCLMKIVKLISKDPAAL